MEGHWPRVANPNGRAASQNANAEGKVKSTENGDRSIYITAACFNAGGYSRFEYLVLVPDNSNTLISAKLSFEVKSFDDSPVELNEDPMQSEALGKLVSTFGST